MDAAPDGPHPHPGGTPPLVGREREQAALREALANAIGGRGSLVLIGGEAGIGKTALAEALCREAAGYGALVLVGRCYDLSETPPYGPWIDLFGHLPADPPLPPLPVAFATIGTVGAVPSQGALFQQVRDFLRAASAQRPLVLLLDDQHWADQGSLDLLRFLAREVTPLAVLLLATYRADELTRRHPLYQLLPALVREAKATRLDLRPLDADGLRALVAAHHPLPPADAARLVAYLADRAEGNPFFTGELLRAMVEGGALRPGPGGAGWALGDPAAAGVPPLLRQVIDGRVDRLGEATRPLLAVAATIGQTVPLTLWAVVAEVAEEALLDPVERAVEAGLLREAADGAAVSFAHALIREALYEGSAAIRRRVWHRRAGEALAAQPLADPDAVSYHFQQAGDDRAVVWLLRAGERAQAAYAWTTAVARFEAVLALAGDDALGEERGWLLLRLSRLLLYADVPKARTYAVEAIAAAEATDDRALVALGRQNAGLLACMAGDVAWGLPQMEAASEALAALDDTERVHLLAHRSSILAPGTELDSRGLVILNQAQIGRFREVRERGEMVVAWQPRERMAHIGLAIACANLGLPEEAVTLYARAVEQLTHVGFHANVGMALWSELRQVTLPYRADDVAARRRLADVVEATFERASGVAPLAPPRFYRVPLLLVEGEWAEAEAQLGPLIANLRSWGQVAAFALVAMATLARLRGEAGRSWRAIRAALPEGPASALGTLPHYLESMMAQRAAIGLALDAGDLTTAREWLVAHDRWLAWSEAVLGQSERHELWALYHRQAGDRTTARSHAERALAHATAPRQPLALLAAHRLLGELATAEASYAEAATHLAEALRLALACAAPYERALTLLAQAELQAATDERDDARATLAEAQALLTPLAARPALARADTVAAALAATPSAPPPAPSFPAGLSAREVEVLRLVAQGHANADIAARLFLSPRTVTTHLTAIYTKLGVDNRAAAVAFAIDHGLR